MKIPRVTVVSTKVPWWKRAVLFWLRPRISKHYDWPHSSVSTFADKCVVCQRRRQSKTSPLYGDYIVLHSMTQHFDMYDNSNRVVEFSRRTGKQLSTKKAFFGDDQ